MKNTVKTVRKGNLDKKGYAKLLFVLMVGIFWNKINGKNPRTIYGLFNGFNFERWGNSTEFINEFMSECYKKNPKMRPRLWFCSYFLQNYLAFQSLLQWNSFRIQVCGGGY